MADREQAQAAVAEARSEFDRCPCVRHADDLDAAISDLARVQ